MFLKQIKMVGFKSFVEPTLLHFNAQKIAVVGPNGCGKSNVIDAIRWVMGESSARFLRGDMMSDVIFNGTSNRRASSMASVEMLLDNSDAYLQGAYVKKGDVSLKREMNRSGESTYYINHQKVRRKDLTDLWLGTGAGARGYAIIGQNMVNQLVEANPEVLKLYLEEAAGVSKYKERRKESADRLSQTADNLLRIADLLTELEQTVLRLEIEAQDALTFQNLRQEYRHDQELLQRIKAQSILDRQNDLQKALMEYAQLEQKSLQDKETTELLLLKLETECQTLQVKIQEEEQIIFKEKVYLEQQQEYWVKRQQDYQRYLQEQKQLSQEQNELNQQQWEEHTRLTELKVDAEKHEMLVQKTEALWISKRTQRQMLENEIREQKHQKATIKQKYQHDFTQLQILSAKKEQSLHALAQFKRDIEHLKQRLHQSECDEYAKKIEHLELAILPQEQQLISVKDELKNLQHQYHAANEMNESLRVVHQEHQARYDQLRQDMLGKEAGYLGLLSSQASECLDLKEPWSTLKDWLNDWKIPREWQKTMDWLWQHFLPNFYCQSEIFPESMIAQSGIYYSRMQKVFDLLPSTLLNQMQVDWVPAGFFDWQSLHVASNLGEAKLLVSKLKTSESVICPEGIWLGHDWIYYLPLDQVSHGGLATRLNEWRIAQKAFEKYELLFLDSQKAYESSRIHYQALQLELEQQIRRCEEQERLLFEQQQQLKIYRQQHEFLLQEQSRQNQAYLQAEDNHENLLRQINDWQMQIEAYQRANETRAEVERSLSMQIQKLQEQFIQFDEECHHVSQLLQEQKLTLMRLKTQIEHFEAQHPKTVHHLNVILKKIHDNQQELLQFENEVNLPKDSWAKQIQVLQKKEEQLQSIQHDLQNQHLKKTQIAQELDDLNHKHLEILEKKWRLMSEKEQNQTAFEEIKDKLQSNFQDIPPEVNEGMIKKKLNQLEQQMQEMGDVNLLAVGLFNQEKDRQTHLLEQKQDLNQAIEELEGAIKTLDQDMQIRMQETLNAINQHLIEIFPQLFGGGEAKFVASCDNLLEASVAVHVQLPGKRPHRIQLLSGGEKALTAVALLFSIFSLNPAPFCLLDEVDAALDDANVQRLAGLIDKLSSTVQFMLITHNPLTMDVADELIGVTMQEPGVSRVVSVNMAKALEMVNKE